jgi:HSP20 family protein
MLSTMLKHSEFLDGFFGGWPIIESSILNTSSYTINDYIENSNDYSITINLAGFSKDDIELLIDDSILTIKNKNSVNDDFFTKYDFTKTYKIPEDVDIDNIQANMKNGILKIVLPKTVKENKTKQIIIN